MSESKKIPFIDLKLQYQTNRELLEKSLLRVCASCNYILGEEVMTFETKFADYIGAHEAIGVASGTDALRLACRALGIKPQDEILIPTNTFIATALAISDLGAIPVPVDVYPDTFLLNLSEAEKRITPRTKGMIPVHLYGQCMDMDSVMSFAGKHNLLVIEDASQAHGAMWGKKRAGSFGNAGCFSFYPGKNIGAFGDGGMVVTNNSSLAEKIRKLRNYGTTQKYVHEVLGTNSRLDAIQAAVLSVKLNQLDSWNQKRFQAACYYVEKLRGIKTVQAPVFDPQNPERHVFHLFVIQCEQRDSLLKFLGEQGIECGVHYPVPVHRQKAYANLQWREGDFPVSDMTAKKILSLPMYPEITEKQIDIVVQAIEKF